MRLPEEFLTELRSYGDEALRSIADALDTEPSVAVRFNRGRGLCPSTGAVKVPWCEAGCYLPVRPVFTFDSSMHQGLYYVQDASSMFISCVIGQITLPDMPVRYLDACAAPGGKTTAAIDSLPDGSVVVANEFVASRAAVLRENLAKWGYPLVTVTQGDTSRFSSCGEIFDIIAADVPCSGEGMMRKDPQAVAQWSPALVRQCAERQMEIVRNLWPALIPGGYFIYSTCTFNRTENESIIRWIIDTYGAESVAVDVDPAWGIHDAIDSRIRAYRFIPGAVRGEGLFMAVLRKPGVCASAELAGYRKVKNKGSRQVRGLEIPSEVSHWILDGYADLYSNGERIKAVPHHRWPGFPFVPEFTVATLRGHDFYPDQQLALSRLFNHKAFCKVAVDAFTAVDYLRCEAVTLPSGTPKGVVLLTYKGYPLGFVKNIGSRANNLYPKTWRILSPRPSELPDVVGEYSEVMVEPLGV